MLLEYRLNSAVDDVYLDFGKVFSTVFHNILRYKLTNYGLHKCIVKWTENWLEDQTHWILISGIKSSGRQVTSGVPQGLVLGQILFNIFINEDAGTECILSKFSQMIQDWEESLTDLDRLDKWAKWNLKVQQREMQSSLTGLNKPRHQDALSDDCLESSAAENFGVLVDSNGT